MIILVSPSKATWTLGCSDNNALLLPVDPQGGCRPKIGAAEHCHTIRCTLSLSRLSSCHPSGLPGPRGVNPPVARPSNDGKPILIVTALHVSSLSLSQGYLDPAVFSVGLWTNKADVYSFGVVLLEIATGRPAVINTSDGESLHLRKVGVKSGLSDFATLLFFLVYSSDYRFL